jgi:hypothetical protein
MDLKETGYDNVGWVQLAQDRAQLLAVMNTVMNFVLHKGRGMSCQLSEYQFLKKDSVSLS